LKTSIFTIFGRTTFANTIPLATNAVPDAHVLNDVDTSILLGFPLRKRLRNVERRPNQN